MRFSTRTSIVCPVGMAEAAVGLWCVVLFGVVAAALGAVVAGAAVLDAGVAAVGARVPVVGVLVAGAGWEPVVCAQAGTAARSEVASKVVANFMASISVTGKQVSSARIRGELRQ